jgi:hypothetical protein
MKIGIREQDGAFGRAFRRQRIPWLRLGFGIVGGLVGVINLVSSDAVFAKVTDPRTMLRVRVNNYTQASPLIVARAEREAGRILGEAGLRMVWLDCPMEHYGGVHVQQNPCLEPLEATDIVLRVLPERTQNKFQDTVFGFAVVPIFASVYYDYALRSAKTRTRASPAWVKQSLRFGSHAAAMGTQTGAAGIDWRTVVYTCTVEAYASRSRKANQRAEH